MDVAVNEAGADEAPLEVQDPRLWTRAGQHLVVRAHGDDAVPPDGEGRGGG